MSETNEAKKEPGQVAYEMWAGSNSVWRRESGEMRAQWASIDRAVLDASAPRLAALEAENADLHRQVSALRVDAEAQRKIRVAAEHERNLLTDQVGRDVLAALVEEIPSEVRHTTLAQRDEALKRAADLDAEVIALRARVEAVMHGSEALERERDEAVRRAQQAESAADAFMRERDLLDTRVRHFVKRAEEAEAKVREVIVDLAQTEKDRDKFEGQAQSVAELLDVARKEHDEARRSTEERRIAASTQVVRAERAEAEVRAQARRGEQAERERDEARDGWQRVQNDLVGARAEIANLKAQASVREQRSRYECVTPAGTLYLDDPDANSVQFREAVRCAAASINPRPDAGPEDRVAAGEAIRKFEDGETSAGELRDELQLPEAPAPVERKPPFRNWTDEDRAKVVPGATVWYGGDALVEPHRVELTSTVQECGGCATVRTGPFVLALDNCDPATIEPPATQAAPVERPPAHLPVACAKCGYDAVSGGTIDGVFCCSGCVERPPAPDLRRGDRATGRDGTEYVVREVPYMFRSQWRIPVTKHVITMVVTADDLDLSTRVRTWQSGEVVPHAPLTVARKSDTGARAFTATGGINPSLPLGEPWTQTGI